MLANREWHPKLDTCAFAFTGSDVNRALEAIENVRTTSMPTPRPETSVTSLAG